MYTVVYPVLFISIGVGAVLVAIFREEKHYAKISGKKVFNLNALLDDIRRQEEKKQHAAVTAAKRARRVKMRNESLASARAIRELVDGLDRDADTAVVPVIRVTCQGDGSGGRS